MTLTALQSAPGHKDEVGFYQSVMADRYCGFDKHRERYSNRKAQKSTEKNYACVLLIATGNGLNLEAAMLKKT